MELELDDYQPDPKSEPLKRLVQTYKIVGGFADYDLETKVNHYLQQPGNEGCVVHGDLQMLGHSEFKQLIVGYKYVD